MRFTTRDLLWLMVVVTVANRAPAKLNGRKKAIEGEIGFALP